jgi:hypothetical protein
MVLIDFIPFLLYVCEQICDLILWMLFMLGDAQVDSGFEVGQCNRFMLYGKIAINSYPSLYSFMPLLEDLKNPHDLSRQLFEGVEAQYAASFGSGHPGRRSRFGLCRKAIYFMGMTGCHLQDIVEKPYPILKKDRKKIGKDLLDIVYIDMHVSDRSKSVRRKLVIPIFLDFATYKDKEPVIFEQEMWDIITDSWPYDTIKLNFSGFGNYASAAQMLERVMKGVKFRAHGVMDKLTDREIKLEDLRTLRIYDLLENKREYGMNSDVVAKMLGFSGSEWLVRSKPYQVAVGGKGVMELLGRLC